MTSRSSQRRGGAFVARRRKRRGPPSTAQACALQNAIAITQAYYAHVLREIASEGAAYVPQDPPRGCESLSGERLTDLRATARAWAWKIDSCADKVWVAGHEKCGTRKTVCSCCGLPCCPRRARRYAQTWVHRAERLASALETYGLGLNADAERVPVPRSLAWRFMVLSPRRCGDVFQQVNRVVKLRADLARWLEAEYGMVAAFGSLEREGTAHVNMVALCQYVPQSVLEHWLRSRDCTVRGCHHPANDRCESCKRSGRGDCHHPETMPDGRLRPRCQGSWVAHVKTVYERDTRGQRVRTGKSTAVAAVREAVKYATKPTKQGKSPHRFETDAEWIAELEHAREAMLFYLALRGRHRVETYGLAKKRMEGEDEAPDDLPPRVDGQAPTCPKCKQPMDWLMFGARDLTLYHWSTAPPRGS